MTLQIKTSRGLLCRVTVVTSCHSSVKEKVVSVWMLVACFTWLGHFWNGNALLMSHEPQHREDRKPSHHTGSTVQQTQPQAVSAKSWWSMSVWYMVNHFNTLLLIYSLGLYITMLLKLSNFIQNKVLEYWKYNCNKVRIMNSFCWLD